MGDREIIQKCKNGDKSAFQELIAKYHLFVFKFLFKISENEQLAEDLTQEVFIKVIRNIEKFDVYGKAKFSTYVIKMSKNIYIDYLRKEKKFFQLGPIKENFLDEVSIPSFEESLLDKLSGNDVIKQLENLTDEQKYAIKLKYIEGLTLKEIGGILDIEPKTVKSRIHNGIVKLKKMLIVGGEKNGR